MAEADKNQLLAKYGKTLTCNKCGETKNTLSDFPIHKRTLLADGGTNIFLHRTCKDCRRKKAAELYTVRSSAPPKSESCDCCGRLNESLVMDHCHETLVFRGWVCSLCNHGIGYLGDNLLGVMKAVKYLERVEWANMERGKGLKKTSTQQSTPMQLSLDL